MAVESKLSENGEQLVIYIKGRFDFSAHQDFRTSYETLDKQPQRYQVDMGEATYLDSSALGMLLLLRDHASTAGSEVQIVNCTDDVKKILTISNFEQLFTIDSL